MASPQSRGPHQDKKVDIQIILTHVCLTIFILAFYTWVEINRTLLRTQDVLQKGTPEGRTILVLEGCNQHDGAATWLAKNQVFTANDRIILLRRRFHESYKPFLSHAKSWVPLWLQFYEVLNAVKIAQVTGSLPAKFDVAGHSVGATMARRLARALPTTVDRVLMLCSPTEGRAELLKNGPFWKQVGWRALPHSLWTLVVFWRGFTPQTKVTQLAYTGPIEKKRLTAFRRQMLPDSTLTFYGLLWYKGGELTEARAKGWSGRALYIATPHDLLFPIGHTARDVERQKEYAMLVTLAPGTPHCFWFADDDTNEYNRRQIRAAIQGL